MSSFEIRTATPEEAGVIAALNLACWREAYDGVAPAELLAAASLEERLTHWRAQLRAASPPSVFLAVDGEGRAVGFASCALQRTGLVGRLAAGGDIEAIYLLKSAQRRGLGRRLMALVADDLRARGARWASLRVLRDNLPARRFYEALGGRRIGVDAQPRGAAQVLYGWRDLRRLAGAASETRMKRR